MRSTTSMLLIALYSIKTFCSLGRIKKKDGRSRAIN